MVQTDNNNLIHSKIEKVFEWCKNNFIDILVFLFCLIYILRAVARINESEKTVLEIIADGVVALLGNYLVKTLLSKRGLLKGLISPKFIATTNFYGKKKGEISTFVEELHPFCDKLNADRLRQKQSEFLLKYAMNYNKFIKGAYDYDPKKKNILKECRKITVFEYTPEMLTNAYDNATSDKKIMTATIKKYERSKRLSDALFGVLIFLLFGYYTIKPANEFSVELLAWYALHIIFFLTNGAINHSSSYFFVTETLRGKINRAVTIIDSFINIRNKHPDIFKVDFEIEKEPVIEKNAQIKNLESSISTN